MSQIQKPELLTLQDWYNFITTHPEIKGNDLLSFRRQCYQDIEKYRGFPLLVYASKFIDYVPPEIPNFIDLSDVDGFTDLVNSVSKEKKIIDVLIHSPGGRPDATERIVNILRNRFEQVNFLIPHSAYSAATMLCLSGDSIILHSSATLGPIDPQINGIPARSIKRGFDNAKENIAIEGPKSLPAYIPLIEKYTLDLLELCEDSEKLSKELVYIWLKKYMFKNEKYKRIQNIVNYFSNYDKHLLHSRPISLEKLTNYGLKISYADEKLQKLLWETYIMINGFFSVSPFYKLFENSTNLSWGRQLQINKPDSK